MQSIGEADLEESVGGSGLAQVFGEAAKLQREHDILEDGAPGQEVGILKDVGDGVDGLEGKEAY